MCNAVKEAETTPDTDKTSHDHYNANAKPGVADFEFGDFSVSREGRNLLFCYFVFA